MKGMKKIRFRTLTVAICATLIAGCGLYGGKRNAPAADTDADGVADTLDSCLETATGSVVDDTGCQVLAGPIADLDFLPGDHRLNSNSRAALDELIADLNKYPSVSISLGGHTDNRGSAAANLELSKQRVMSVVRYLVSNGIDPARLKPYGYGESQPVVSNATAEGRVKNRRIEVSVIAQ